MPEITVNNVKLYYEESGSGSETIVFSHSLLFNLRMFDKQIEEVKHRFRCITFDFRGQGKSEVTEKGYDLGTLTEDAAELIRALDCAPCHFVGFSMGGMVGLRLAVRHPDLIRSLSLIDTTASDESPSKKRRYKLLVFIARNFGLKTVLRPVMDVMFGRAFLKDSERTELRKEWENHFLANDRNGIRRAIKGVMERKSVVDTLDLVKVPTLILVGEEDMATPIEDSEEMDESISDSRLFIIPRAGHMSPVEEPEIVNAHLISFLEEVQSSGSGASPHAAAAE